MTIEVRHSQRMRSVACLAFIQILLIVLSFSAGCSGNLLHGGAVIVPHIVPVEGAGSPPQPSYSFPFEDATITLTMAVDGPVYAGAKVADKEVTIYGNVSESDWLAQSYRSMIDEPNQGEFYTGLQKQLREVRDKMGLNNDEFADLMVAFVQSIPYETTPENPAKFPIETFAEKSGDCDDKSLLLAALLSREGFRTALLSFPNESHMAVGIACDGPGYRDTGLGYIETTNLSFIGVPPDGLGAGVNLSSDPIVISIGAGNQTYGSCQQTSTIHRVYLETDNRFYELTERAEEMKSELRDLSGKGNMNAYNRQVSVFNNLVSEMNRVATIHNYIANHQYDRKGTYTWVMAHPL